MPLNPPNPCASCTPSFLQVVLLGGALALSVGSSGTKHTAKSSVTLAEPQCRAEIPQWLEQSKNRYVFSCRYEGGIPNVTHIKKVRMGKALCSDGTYRHALRIICKGAEFNQDLTPSGKNASAKASAAAVEKPDIAKALLEALNDDRAERKLTTLRWSDKLATFAAEWVAHIAKLGGTRPISSDIRKTGQGETIWIGPADTLSVEKIVREWGRNKHLDAATLVGCAAYLAGDTIIAVCRSWPPGK